MTRGEARRAVFPIAVTMALLVLGLFGLMHREIEAVRRRAKAAESLTAKAELAADLARTRVEQMQPRVEMIERDVLACRARSEWLRSVLEVVVHAPYPDRDRIALPDPPPGWEALRMGHRDKPGGSR